MEALDESPFSETPVDVVTFVTGEKYLNQSINSIINQSYKKIQILIWDDASNDSTIKIIRSFKDKRINLFRNKYHLGLGLSRCKAQKK